jgi:hypothetical protein
MAAKRDAIEGEAVEAVVAARGARPSAFLTGIFSTAVVNPAAKTASLSISGRPLRLAGVLSRCATGPQARQKKNRPERAPGR